jgi:hypothetical protein
LRGGQRRLAAAFQGGGVSPVDFLTNQHPTTDNQPMPEHEYEHVLEIDHSGGERSTYSFEAVGYVHGEQVNDHDEVREKSASGQVNGGTDVYSFATAMRDFEIDNLGPVTLRLDGTEVDPFHLKMRTLTVETPADKAPYEFAVSGRVIGTSETNPQERIFGDGRRAAGRVRSSGQDKWHFSGVLTGWPDSNQPLAVTVDNKKYEYEGNPPVGP